MMAGMLIAVLTVRHGRRVGLLPGYTMDRGKCESTQFPMAVQRNIYKCVDCTWWQPTYCVGVHECLYYISEGRVSAWDNVQYIADGDVDSIKMGDTSFFSNFDQTGKITRDAMGDKQAILASLLAWSEEILKRMPVPGDTR